MNHAMLAVAMLLPSTANAGWCFRPCAPEWRWCEPSCEFPLTIEEETCVQIVADAITERGVGNLAHLSQTGSYGGYWSDSWTPTSSVSIDGDFGVGGGGFGGIGGGWSGPGQRPAGPISGSPNGDGSGGTEIPSSGIPEPSGFVVWVLVALWIVSVWRIWDLIRSRTMNATNPDRPAPQCYTMGGGWGDRIEWSTADQFIGMEHKTTFRCHGWKHRRPRAGDTLKAEFHNSWITFEFTDVEYCRDPSDMFFATVKPIKQDMK